VLSAQTSDTQPSASKPATTSPTVPAKLTIESLAGKYKAVIDEQKLKEMLGAMPKQHGAVKVPLESLEANLRMVFDQTTLTINADGTYEARMGENQYGKVKIDGNKFLFTADSAKPLDGTNGSNSSKCTMYCTFTLITSADGKTLLVDDAKNSLPLLRGYVKQ